MTDTIDHGKNKKNLVFAPQQYPTGRGWGWRLQPFPARRLRSQRQTGALNSLLCAEGACLNSAAALQHCLSAVKRKEKVKWRLLEFPSSFCHSKHSHS